MIRQLLLLLFIIPFAHAQLLVGDLAAYELISSESELVEQNIYLASEFITISKPVKGDVFASGKTVRLESEIEGDVSIAAQTIIIDAPVTGDVRLAGQWIVINADISGEAVFLAETVMVADSVEVASIYTVAKDVQIDGAIEHDAEIFAEEVKISGLINENAKIQSESLSFIDEGKVRGDLEYKATLVKPKDLPVQGQITPLSSRKDPVSFERRFADAVFDYASFFLVGFFFLIFAGKLVRQQQQAITDYAGIAFGTGLLILFFAPIVLLFLAITLVGLPAAIIGAVLYALLLYVAKLPFILLIGSWITTKSKMSSLAIGLLVFVLLSQIELFGFVLWLVATIFGIGSLVIAVRTSAKK